MTLHEIILTVSSNALPLLTKQTDAILFACAGHEMMYMKTREDKNRMAQKTNSAKYPSVTTLKQLGHADLLVD